MVVSRRQLAVLAAAVVMAAVLAAGVVVTRVGGSRSAPTGSVPASYGSLPLRFDANLGQEAHEVMFLATGDGAAVALSPGGATLELAAAPSSTRAHIFDATSQPAFGPITQASGSRVAISLVGSDAAVRPVGVDKLAGSSNYLIGQDRSKWLVGVPGFSSVLYRGVYPGIDLEYGGTMRGLQYDFTVRAGANPDAITVELAGATELGIDAAGNLVVTVGGRQIVQDRPVIYQTQGAARSSVAGRYVMRGSNRYGFAIDAYDHSQPLIIDPTLAYSTYVGGSAFDAAYGVAVDSTGAAYVTGVTTSVDFPLAGSLTGANPGHARVFIQKLNPAGNGLVYSTYLGGTGDEEGLAIAIDAAGEAIVAGTTTSTDFPTVNAAQPASGGGADAFVAKLGASGSSLAFSTYLGGGATDIAYGVAVDASGNAYVAGVTHSTNFPVVAALQGASGGGADAFVAKLLPTGATSYSTYLGGSGDDGASSVAVDSAGNAYVAGMTTSTNFPTASALQPASGGSSDAFVARLNPAGSALTYSTYLGGSGYDTGIGIAVDQSGDAFVTGYTASANFPTANAFLNTNRGGGDAFVSKLNAAGTALVYSTFLGGSALDYGTGIAVDWYGNAYVTGITASPDFQSYGTLQGYGGGSDAFATMISAGGGLTVYSTYLGGSGSDAGQAIAVDSAGAAYVVGTTTSANFPTSAAIQSANHGGNDAFIARLLSPLPASWWPTYMGDQTRSGANTSQVLLNTSTAANLRLQWMAHAGSFVTGQPAIGNGLVYWGAWDGYERATDPSGRTVWATFLGKTVTAPQPLPDCLGGNLGITGTASLITIPGGAVLYVAGGDASLYALDASTGAVVWRTSLGVQPNQFLWSSPLFYAGSVYEGVASFQECPAVQGQMVQLNAATGAVQHTWKAVPDGCTGGPVSSSAAVDATTGTIFFTTGDSPNSCPTPYDKAMIALRASDLSLVGSWQIPPSAPQSGDSDFLAAPTLFTAQIGGVQRSLVGVANKDGVYYVFDRSNVSAGPVWTATVGAVGDCPTCGPPGAAIAPSAWDGTSVYVGANTTTINGVTCNGSVRALDPATGAFRWEHCLGTVVIGAVSASRGLVVAASGPYVFVLSAATGATLFTYHDTNPGPPPVGGTADFWAGAAIGQGVIYEGNIDGTLFAFSV